MHFKQALLLHFRKNTKQHLFILVDVKATRYHTPKTTIEVTISQTIFLVFFLQVEPTSIFSIVINYRCQLVINFTF